MFSLHFSLERWKYNPTFEIWVSNKGHFRNKDKADIAPRVDRRTGYCCVFVHGSINKYIAAHRVVMLTWKPTPEAENLTVDHLDHNKRNNAVDNLEWVSEKENLRRAANDAINLKTEELELVLKDNQRLNERKGEYPSDKDMGTVIKVSNGVTMTFLQFVSFLYYSNPQNEKVIKFTDFCITCWRRLAHGVRRIGAVNFEVIE